MARRRRGDGLYREYSIEPVSMRGVSLREISMTPPSAPPELLAERNIELEPEPAPGLEPPAERHSQPPLRSLNIERPHSSLSPPAFARESSQHLSPSARASPRGSPRASPYASPYASPRGSPAGAEAHDRSGGWDRPPADAVAVQIAERVPNPLRREHTGDDRLSPEPLSARRHADGNTPPLRPAPDPEWDDFPDLAIHVHGREMSKSELRRLVVGTVSLILLVATVVLMLVGRVTVPGVGDPPAPATSDSAVSGPSGSGGSYGVGPRPPAALPPSPAPTRSPPPVPDSPAVLQGTMIVGGTTRFNERRFRSDVAYVLGLDDSQIIVTSAKTRGNFATEVGFDVFLTSTAQAQATRERFVTYASMPGSPLLTAPSIEGTAPQQLQIALHAIAGGGSPTEGVGAQHDLQDGAGPMNDVDVGGVDPAQHASSITAAGGDSGVIRVVGDASAVAFVNGHVIGSGQGADAASHALSFTAHCDDTQVFAVSAHSAASMPSILAEVAHCGRTNSVQYATYA